MPFELRVHTLHSVPGPSLGQVTLWSLVLCISLPFLSRCCLGPICTFYGLYLDGIALERSRTILHYLYTQPISRQDDEMSRTLTVPPTPALGMLTVPLVHATTTDRQPPPIITWNNDDLSRLIS